MEPTFKVIADLFQVPQPGDVEIAENGRKKHGDTAEESRQLGGQCLSQGDYANALRHFKEAVAQRDPGDVDPLIDLAGAYEYGDDYPQALRQYEKALRAKQDAAEPVLGVAELYKRYGRYRDAIVKLEQAIEREPGNAFFRIKLSETLRDARERTRALAAAQAAIAVKPDDAYNHYWTGDLLIEMGRYDEALEYLRAAIELSPGDDFLYLRATVGFWCAGRQVEAIKALRLASELDPEKHMYHGLLGILLEETEQKEEADLESARASKMDRYDHDLLGRILAEMKIEP
ncbi:MAG: tetratricopeptide repeat protein [Fimbriimonas sp.]|nr:tetratricopeptide repeat protein [Fimbriimonas sp.]